MSKNKITNPEQGLVAELSMLIEQSRREVVVVANSAVTLLFWQLGKRINEDILQNKRADYGKKIVSTVSAQLKLKYGKNFELGNLRRMMQFAEQFTDVEIVVTLSRQLSWSHFLVLIPLKTQEARLFYAQLSLEQALGIRALRKQIAAKTFERTTIANLQNKTEQTDIHNIFVTA